MKKIFVTTKIYVRTKRLAKIVAAVLGLGLAEYIDFVVNADAKSRNVPLPYEDEKEVE